MNLKFPLTAIQNPGARFAHLVDADDRVIAGGLLLEDAEQLVRAANAGVEIQAQPLAKQPRRKNAKQRIAEDLKASDVSAQLAGRENIEYGHYDSLPQGGEHVARVRARRV